MIENATVHFTDGFSEDVEKVKFKTGGWVGLRISGRWEYHSPHQIARIVPNDD